MKQFEITGMSCAACSARVESAVSSLKSVTSCSVNLLTGIMAVEGSASDAEIIKAVTDAGYGASPREKSSVPAPRSTEVPEIRRRLILSLIFLAVLMYFTMGHAMLGFPVPKLFEDPLYQGILQLVLTTAVIFINRRFFISGTKAVLHGAPNMDTLVSMGAAAAYIYSTVLLFSGGKSGTKDLFFESAAMILTLITVGKLLEAVSKGKTTNAIRSLMDLSPKTATVIRDGKEETVPLEDVAPGDVFAVRPGGAVPVDGTVISGFSSVDESPLTGESIPADKTEGDRVFAGCINVSGYITCRATGVGKDTALSHIIDAVSEAAATKAPVQKTADRVSGIFVPVVMGIALVTCAVWLIINGDIGHALSRGISVLVISCPCSLGLATPVAVMVGSGIGARNGIFFKTAASLENAGKTETVVLDKTGTVTVGEPEVTDVIPAESIGEDELLRLAAAAEKKSGHPLSRAVCRHAGEMPGIPEAEDFTLHAGSGISATVDGKKVRGGNARFMGSIPDDMASHIERLSLEGKTPLCFSADGVFIGIIAVSDRVRPDSADAVRALRDMGIKVMMVTGDNELCAKSIAEDAGIAPENVSAGVLPEGKSEIIKGLRKHGKVAMVGDGINDSPALTAADTGIAIGTGVDIAVESADTVLMNSTISDVVAAIRLSRRTLRNIKENLFWAFFYNALGIPLAAGVFTPLLGWELSPAFAAAAMSLSSFCVVMNALRLNFTDIHTAGHDGKIRHKEIKTVTKTMTVEGMMCPHCEARVKKSLEALDGVGEAQVSHEKNEAVVTLEKEISDRVLIDAVESEGYTVTSVK